MTTDTLSTSTASSPTGPARLPSDTGRWLCTIPVKNGWIRLLLRGAALPVIVTALGALFSAHGPAPIRPNADGVPPASEVVFLMLGFLIFGQIVILVTSAWLYLREVISRELGFTYTAMPNRPAVVVGTGLFAGLFAWAVGLICVLVGVSVFTQAASGDLAATFASGPVQRMLLGLPIGTTLLAMLAVAIAVVIRQPIITVILLVVWAAFMEDSLDQLPGIGAALHRIAPMNNAYYMAGVADGPGIAGSPWMSLGWLLLLAMALLALAAFVESHRPGWAS